MRRRTRTRNCNAQSRHTGLRSTKGARQRELRAPSRIYRATSWTLFCVLVIFSGSFRYRSRLHHIHRGYQSISRRPILGRSILPNVVHVGHRFAIRHIGGCCYLAGRYETVSKPAERNDYWGKFPTNNENQLDYSNRSVALHAGVSAKP